MVVNSSTFNKVMGAARPLEVLGITALVPSAEHLLAFLARSIAHIAMNAS